MSAAATAMAMTEAAATAEAPRRPFNPTAHTVVPIEFDQARPLIEQSHYTHSLKKGRFCFGLRDPDGRLVGCAVYGQPSMRMVAPSIIEGGDETNVLELLRLWVDDRCGRNAESWFLARTIKALPSEVQALVAYSAPGAGHYGACYQAANWLYVGRSLSGQNYHYLDRDGGYVHKRPPWVAAKKNGTTEKEEAARMGLVRVEEGRKYVYVYLRDKRAVLKRKVRPYPKPGVLAREGYDGSDAHPPQGQPAAPTVPPRQRVPDLRVVPAPPTAQPDRSPSRPLREAGWPDPVGRPPAARQPLRCPQRSPGHPHPRAGGLLVHLDHAFAGEQTRGPPIRGPDPRPSSPRVAAPRGARGLRCVRATA